MLCDNKLAFKNIKMELHFILWNQIKYHIWVDNGVFVDIMDGAFVEPTSSYIYIHIGRQKIIITDFSCTLCFVYEYDIDIDSQ